MQSLELNRSSISTALLMLEKQQLSLIRLKQCWANDLQVRVARLIEGRRSIYISAPRWKACWTPWNGFASRGAEGDVRLWCKTVSARNAVTSGGDIGLLKSVCPCQEDADGLIGLVGAGGPTQAESGWEQKAHHFFQFSGTSNTNNNNHLASGQPNGNTVQCDPPKLS